MYTEHLFLVIAVVFVLWFAVHAWKNGVVGMLWGFVGALSGIVGGILLYRMVIAGLALSFGVKLSIAFVAGLIIYLIVRTIAKSMLLDLFAPDGALSFLADGFGGMLVSLVPSLITVAILAMGLRVGGTLLELRRYDALATPNHDFLAKNYPKQPLIPQWRDGLESLPGARDGLDLIEPTGRVADRNLAGLLIVSKKPPLLRHLSENPESKPIFETPAFQRLLASEEVQAINAKGDRLALLRHPEVRAAALDPTLRPLLRNLELSRLVDGFLLSPEWQKLLEGYQRDPQDTKPM